MILKFKPILKTLVWGTENWVLSGVAGNETVVAEGPFAGRNLNEVYGTEFPLLIKFIDARKDLSIQVHPDDALAAKRHRCKGKTEMWYMTGAAPGAHLLAGNSREISPGEYVRLVSEGRIVDVLADHKVAPGDVFFLPAGRIHAICGGCVLAEIQETSDITYRIFDYNRPGLDGKPRELHTELAKDAIDYRVHPDYRTRYEHRENAEVVLVEDRHFVTSLYEISAPVSTDLRKLPVVRPDPATGMPMKNFLVVICTEGSAGISTEKEGPVALGAGEALLVDDTFATVTFTPAPAAKLLTSHL